MQQKGDHMKLGTVVNVVALIALWSATAFSRVSLDDFAVGATYHMTLTTGDDLEGVVDSKTDTSLVLDCKGNAYTFAVSLISDFKLVSPPSQSGSSAATGQPDQTQSITYDQLKARGPGADVVVKIKSGSVFSGKVLSIDDDNIRLDVAGSVIPISKVVVDQLSLAAAKPLQSAAAPAPAPAIIYDTLIVKNPENDDYGRPREDLTIVGNIVKEDNLHVTVRKPDDSQATFTFDQVIRIVRHSADNPDEERIQRYAKPLFCPQDMVLVDLPPGIANRPFFKVCVDKYEYPNRQETLPTVNISFDGAKQACEKQGKRLCTAQEWQWTCSGREGYAYPYGYNFEKENCNSESRAPEPSGTRNKCISKFGAVDMTGNVWEWVSAAGGSKAAMGGPVSKCQTVSPGESGEAKTTIGLRCCKSN
jgi:hypothetical protein